MDASYYESMAEVRAELLHRITTPTGEICPGCSAEYEDGDSSVPHLASCTHYVGNDCPCPVCGAPSDGYPCSDDCIAIEARLAELGLVDLEISDWEADIEVWLAEWESTRH